MSAQYTVFTRDKKGVRHEHLVSREAMIYAVDLTLRHIGFLDSYTFRVFARQPENLQWRRKWLHAGLCPCVFDGARKKCNHSRSDLKLSRFVGAITKPS